MRTSTSYFAAGILELLAVAPLQAQNIVDRAGFFSADVVKQAEESVKELERKHSVPVRVETFGTVPDDQADKVKGMSAKDRAAFFAKWLKELAQERKAKGVFVLICREPSHLRVGISKELHKRGFTDADRDEASEKLMTRFKEKKYDRGLQDLLAALRATAERKLTGAVAPVATRRASPADAGAAFPSWSGWLCLGIGGVVAIIAILSVVGAMFRNTNRMPGPGGFGGGPAGNGGYGGGGGGGLMGGLLSGLGGALLGNWIYDQWSGGRSAHAGEPRDAGWSGHTSGPTDDNYQDFNSSGGDFGGSSGGDFGGGDSGGGGGDF